MEGYRISTNFSDFDIDLIHNEITNSYWAKGMPKPLLVKAIKHSLCFAILDKEGRQVGFSRVITDKATFAYLADVFVVSSHRGLGLSKFMLKHIVNHRELQGLRRMLLATADAHGLYQQFGFKSLERPELLMQITNSNVYKTLHGGETVS